MKLISAIIIFICLFSGSLIAGIFDTITGAQSAVTSNVQSAVGSATAAASSSAGGGMGISKKTTSVFGYDETEVLDYTTQKIGDFDIRPLGHGIQFKAKLTVDQYQILLKDWLNNVYGNKFESKAWALKYFVRALAEITFSNNGYLSTKEFDSVLKGFENYRRIDKCIAGLEISSPIKYSLAKLFAVGCVYTRYIDTDFTSKAIDIIKKIPKDVVLYHMEEQSEELRQEGKIADATPPAVSYDNQNLVREQLGNYVGYDHGENLYYICMSYYDNFKDIPRDKQIKLINQIYSYNPTLMEAPPIKRKRFLWNYIKDYFFPDKNPEVMKYCVRGYVNWVLLPKSI